MTPLKSFLLAYLINSIWQVPLVFFIAKGIVRLAAKCGTAMHHRIWVAALILQAVLPASTSSPISSVRTLLQWISLTRNTSPSSFHITTLSGEGSLHGTLALPNPLLLSSALLYLCALLYFATSFAWSLLKAHRLRRSSLPITLTASAHARWNSTATTSTSPKPPLPPLPTSAAPSPSAPVTA